MKENDSRGMVIAPVILFIGMSFTVFYGTLFINDRTGLFAALLPPVLTAGAAVYAAVILVRRNRTEDILSRDDLRDKRGIGVVFGIIAASLWVMFTGSFADSDLDRIKHLALGLLVGAGAFLAAMAICSAALFYLEAARMRAGKTAAFLTAVLAALTGGALLGGFLASVFLRPVTINEDLFLADTSAVSEDALVEFGSWPQNGSEPEPIVWRVIEKEDGALTLMSEYALEPSYYYFDTCEYFKYRESAVRALVSGDFPAEAFTEEERALLLPQPVGGGEEDLAAILTLTQAEKVFGAFARCPATENVKEKIPFNKAGDCEFFIRPDDPDDTDVYLYCFNPVKTKHTIRMRYAFDVNEHGVRPVIRIRTDG